MANSTQLTVLFQRAPHGSVSGREGLDLLLLNASYDVVSAAAFVGDGVYQLLANQQPETVASKNHIVTFKALPMYDVDTILVCQQSLQERGISADQLIVDATIVAPSEIAALLGHSKEVLTF
ncbi:sulfurtransferase complex subunit TusC [Ferrimonas lipolytica]|uniref:Sulfurtransferase complex subunit TusC n=1 Tax=Ferrimonas lipolytica TaxID=2724191 RepID=A0A6H1UFB1_9GAMM|nr:sulfurtransferase complex subunit TusC [Ferrimonas lipolytica]QIZ76482.1 sulfurtransferase complex subunit TusC [Ferrimonas lipolytica]